MITNNSNAIEEIKKIYEPLVDKYGNSSEAVMYDVTPVERYKKLAEIADVTNKSILDIGCGVGGVRILEKE